LCAQRESIDFPGSAAVDHGERTLTAIEMLVRVAYDLRQAQRQIMSLGQQSTDQRLAIFLLEVLRYPESYDLKGCA
jgi:hypothetical protein